jgi:sugar-specific transcriptional regulator TrmB
LSLKRVIEKLETLGLSNGDAMLYIYLAKDGPKKARDLSDELGITKQQLYARLRKLQEKKIITKNSQMPSIFCAVAFEKVLDLLVSIKAEQSEAILETKKELLSKWRAVDWKNNKRS